MFQTIVLVISAFYAFLIVYAYIPSEVIPLDELKSPDDRFFYHSKHAIRYMLVPAVQTSAHPISTLLFWHPPLAARLRSEARRVGKDGS